MSEKTRPEKVDPHRAEPREESVEIPINAAPPVVLRTPREWAIAKGHLLLAKPVGLPEGAMRIGPAATDRSFPIYAAADALHGWSESAHHVQGDKAFRLSEADYAAALVAAAAYPAVSPHRQAMTPQSPHKAGTKARGFARGTTIDGVRTSIAALEARFTAANKPVKVNRA
jgi:hypothetical protein